MKHYQIIIAILAVAVSFASCSSSDDEEKIEPTKYEYPNWASQLEQEPPGEKPDEKYPTDQTIYFQLPDALKLDNQKDDTNNEVVAAFCGTECRAIAKRFADDTVWFVRVYGNVGDEIVLKYYSAYSKYMYQTIEPIVLTSDTGIGTYDVPIIMSFKQI